MQVEFHARVQAMYNDLRNQHPDTNQEALVVTWDGHHQALVAAVLLEGHIERLSHCVSMDVLAAIDIQAVAVSCKVKAIQGATQGICQLVLKHRFPQQRATLGMLPRGRCPQPALCVPEGHSLLRNPVQTLTQRQPPRPWIGHSL